MSAVLSPVAVEYPSTDGKPVAESDFQRDYLLYVVDALQEHFRAQNTRSMASKVGLKKACKKTNTVMHKNNTPAE